MRLTHTDPRLLLAALAAAFAFALAVAGAPDLTGLDLFPGGAPAEAPPTEPTGTPAWVDDPMASPVEALRGR